MPSRTRSHVSTDAAGGRAGTGRTRTSKGRLDRRKIIVLGILIALPLALIASVFGSGGGRSASPSSVTASPSAPPGADLMIAACSQIADLAKAATGGTATPSTMLSDMEQASEYAANAAQASPVWEPMAGDIAKLNTMVQSDTGNAASFNSQLDTVTQECGAVATSNGFPPTGAG
jgi:hypothetical protein